MPPGSKTQGSVWADNRESGENPERSGHCEKGVCAQAAIGSEAGLRKQSGWPEKARADVDLKSGNLPFRD